MKTIRLDEVDFEVTPQVAQAISKELARLDNEKDALQNKVQELQTKLDAAEKLVADGKIVVDPKVVTERVAVRLQLVRTADKVLGTDHKVKLDELTDDDVRKAVIVKVFPQAKLDGKDSTYLAARFDAAVELTEKKPESTPHLALIRATDAARGDGAENVSTTSREQMIQRNRDAYKATK